MRRSGMVLAFLVVAPCLLAGHPAADAGGNEKPFPFNRTQIVKDGVFYVEGRLRIPPGVEITVQKDTSIVGRGDGATIEVEGRLTVQGNHASRVVFDGVTVELQPQFDEIRVVETEFRGASKGVITAEDAPAEGQIRIASSAFQAPTALRTTLTGMATTVDLRDLCFTEIFDIKAVTAPGAKGSNVKMLMKGCLGGRSGFTSGIRVDGLAAVEVRETELAGAESSFVDCGSVTIDACYIRSDKLSFSQKEAGRYGKCSIRNSDLHSKAIALAAPERSPPEKMKIENCWFGGETTISAIRKSVISDFDDDPKVGILASVERPSAKPLQLCWTIRR